MVQFSKLRLTGFKSFVDPTELVISNGTTGIVGPNGCGKSNLVEALRWVMGETSAKRMRGGEMDDVIFAGTQSRPARNVAEVGLVLDNSDRRAAPQFNDEAELEVTRRIERGHGSGYEINGRDVRARDVQLLFADAASGAHSTALVSQGRIGAIINAKPTDRRSLLEEAAGITGLHSRRHEAELRLKAAETNLARLDDVIKTLENQLGTLKKQARQATRYRNVAEQMRRQEALLLHLEAEATKLALTQAEAALEAAGQLVAESTEAVAAATTHEAGSAEALPPLRQAEAEAAARLQRLTLDREALARELAQVEAQTRAAEQRRQQMHQDRGRAQAQADDAKEADAGLAREAEAIDAFRPEADAARQAAEVELATAGERVTREEQALEALTRQLAADEARAQGLRRRAEDIAQRLQRHQRQRQETEGEHGRLTAERDQGGALAAAETELHDANSALATARETAETAAQTLAQSRQGEEQSRHALAEVERSYNRLTAEIAALASVVEPKEQALWPAAVDAVTVEPGFEAALGAALGDDLDAPLDDTAPAHWAELPPLDPVPHLPDGVASLALYVRGPAPLNRRLSQIGLVPDVEAGRRLQPLLVPGQRLVSKAGDFWRWDGFTAKADAPTLAAQRLQQKNRLAELRQQQQLETPDLDARRARHLESRTALNETIEAERLARQAVNAAFQRANQANERQAALARKAAALESRLGALGEALQRLAAEGQDLEGQQNGVAGELAGLPDLAALRAQVTEARASLAESRGLMTGCRSTLERLLREAEVAKARLAAIGQERASWRRRLEEAERFLSELAERESKLTAELELLQAQPAAIAEKQGTLAGLIETASQARRDAADALASAETQQLEAQRALKAAEQRLAEARESRVRAEGHGEQTRIALETLIARVAERIGCGLDGLLAAAEIDPGAEMPGREELANKLARLTRERETIGPVNLRAEHEAQELETQIQGMQNERSDLVAAIARLRQGIASLNREGRERLLAAFETVNRHFSELFIRLFGGGRAHLALTEAEDPLEAGLEIMASPPGKRLSVLSLLSGGEQALTALALLFGVFLTNPAPICVLDEVDAPLDDANVDRFCSLVEELAGETGTRFLIITHHRLTMARMNRLYGVTMSERGISQLVSVDLQAAAALRESA